MKIKLQRSKRYFGETTGQIARWLDCLPFVENSRGFLIHRPRTVDSYNFGLNPPHIAINYWCGNSVNGNKNFTFLDFPPDNALVCEICERRALIAGEKSSHELAGRHVCLGKLRPVNVCPIHAAPIGEMK